MGGGGGCKTGEGGACEVLPLQKEGGGECGTSFSHAEGEPKTFWGSFYAIA